MCIRDSIHSGLDDYCPKAEGPGDPPLDTQGITYELRGRLPENGQCSNDCIIWSVQADATRLFSGDSNGILVVHDFWNYIDCDSTHLNSDGQTLVENSVPCDCNQQEPHLCKRPKLE